MSSFDTPSANPFPGMHNDGGAREYLMGCKWPVPLQEALIADARRIPLRYFICDDSSTLREADGTWVLENNGKIKCSRSAELDSVVRFHVQFATAARAVVDFRCVNKPLRFCSGLDRTAEEASAFISQVFQYPKEDAPLFEPLCTHVAEIAEEIHSHAERLRANAQRASLTIVTSGECRDGDLAQALHPLRGLPVSVVMRLCTDDRRTLQYWRDVDKKHSLGVHVDVLDDQLGEAKEVRAKNPWVVYGEPLHCMREWGMSLWELDLLDEELLSPSSLISIVRLFYGDVVSSFPNPDENAEGFFAALDEEIAARKDSTFPFTWDPLMKTTRPFIDTKAARAKYSEQNCIIT